MEFRDILIKLSSDGVTDNTILQIVEEIIKNGGLVAFDDIKYLVLIAEIGADAIDAAKAVYDDCLFSTGMSDYLVLNEKEREERWEEELENYLDEVVIGSSSPYFDREAWKRDARLDGAGIYLGPYDGFERVFCVEGEDFFIYRVD